MPDDEPSAQLPPNESEFMKQFQENIESYAAAVETGNQEAANQAALAALMLSAAEEISNPTPDILLSQEADACESAGNWAGAEAAYRKLLVLQESSGNLRLVVKPQLDLSRLLRLAGRTDEAWEYACAASAVARRADMFTLLAMALDHEASCALERSDVSRALAAANEALSVIEPGKIFNLIRARALTRRAECLLAQGDLENAEEDLKRGWELLETRHAIGPGSIVALARWWEVQSAIHLRRQAVDQATDALTKAIQYRQHVLEMLDSPNPHAQAALLRVQEKRAAISKQHN